MHDKKLVSSTIIPAGLYVTRDADRQLAANLRQMGRPAYILVARQMGKTNLLLHTKRALESPDTLFLYIDLSSSFCDERECFRLIVDTALDLHADSFKAARSRILEN